MRASDSKKQRNRWAWYISVSVTILLTVLILFDQSRNQVVYKEDSAYAVNNASTWNYINFYGRGLFSFLLPTDCKRKPDADLTARISALTAADQEARAPYNQQKAEQAAILTDAFLREVVADPNFDGCAVGRLSADAVLFFVQHTSDNSLAETIAPIMKNWAQQGLISQLNYTLMEDRLRLRRDQPQIYGTQFRCDGETGRMHAYDLFEPSEVNRRRKFVGLASFNVLARIMNSQGSCPKSETSD